MAEKKAKKSTGGDDARQSNLDSALAQITKTFGGRQHYASGRRKFAVQY